MKLYIRIENGQPVDHPIADWNLQMFVENLDYDSPPEGFMKFIREYPPVVGPLERLETRYEIKDGICYDVHTIIPLSDEEKRVKIEEFKSQVPKPFPSWILDEPRLQWVAPIPLPENNLSNFYWNEETLSWVEILK